MEHDATEQIVLLHLHHRYGAIDSLYHGAVHYLLREIRSGVSGV